MRGKMVFISVTLGLKISGNNREVVAVGCCEFELLRTKTRWLYNILVIMSLESDHYIAQGSTVFS